MNKNIMGGLSIVISILIPIMAGASKIKYDQDRNCVEVVHEINVTSERSAPNQLPSRTVTIFSPKAPYDAVTCTITAPAKVCVGQNFTIDYALQTTKFTHISFWADLLPDSEQGVPVSIIDISHPTIGNLDSEDGSIANLGGKGVWLFPKGLPGNTVQHLVVTARATEAGTIKFTSLMATNPPSYIGMGGTLASCSAPIINSVQVQGVCRQPITVYPLDNVVADSEVSIISVSQASYGRVVLNDDYTITYTPYLNFYGNDSFKYMIQDAAGNTATGTVSVVIEYCPVPAIIKN